MNEISGECHSIHNFAIRPQLPAEKQAQENNIHPHLSPCVCVCVMAKKDPHKLKVI